jgi:hypothetical protein
MRYLFHPWFQYIDSGNTAVEIGYNQRNHFFCDLILMAEGHDLLVPNMNPGTFLFVAELPGQRSSRSVRILGSKRAAEGASAPETSRSGPDPPNLSRAAERLSAAIRTGPKLAPPPLASEHPCFVPVCVLVAIAHPIDAAFEPPPVLQFRFPARTTYSSANSGKGSRGRRRVCPITIANSGRS